MKYRHIWKQLASSKKIAKEDVLAFCIYRAINFKHTPGKQAAVELLRKAFTPVSNQTKLSNGCKRYDGLYNAIYNLRSSAFLAAMDDSDRHAIAEMVKSIWSEFKG